MAKRNDSGAALAIPTSGVPDDEATALAALDDFGDFGGADGLNEVDGEDLRLPVIVWNMKGKDENGRQRQKDEFYDTLNERSFRELRCVLLHLHKSNAFSRFNNDQNENVIHCSSNDRVIGRLRTNHPDLNILEGTERECATCPDKEWQKNSSGKNVRNCDPVYGVFGVMLDDTGKPTDGFLIRFKRTGLAPFKTHLQRHHINRRPLPGGKRGNVPLFAYEVTMRLDLAENGNYATPIIERGPLLSKELIAQLAEQSKFVAEASEQATAVAERQESRYEAGSTEGAGGAQVSGNDFAD